MHFGTGVYANFNLTLLDDGHIYVGNRVLFGPNVVVATANHPLDPELRRYEMQYNRDVYIGDNVWIGAGSVVTRNIPENVPALGYDDIASYENGTCFYGAIVGRYANRIRDGRFELDGREYLLEKNSEESNHVHGVFAGRMFEAEPDGGALRLRYTSPDGEEGFPGTLRVEACYRLREDGSTVLDHYLRLNSSCFTEYAETFAQTGRIIPVTDTPLDFREEHSIGERFLDDYPQFRICTGYDHNMILDGEAGALKQIGTARSERSGICLEAFTTEPAIQLYSANFIHYDPVPHGKNGVRYPKNGAFCMEAQHYPDSVHHPHFPGTVLRPGEVYRQTTVYRFRNDR